MLLSQKSKAQLMSELFQFAIYDLDIGEIIASDSSPSLGVVQGEVLVDAKGFVSPSIDDSSEAVEEVLMLWRSLKFYPQNVLPSLPDGINCQPYGKYSLAKYEGIACPRCGYSKPNYAGWVRMKNGRDAKRRYYCPICNYTFLDHRLRGARRSHSNRIIKFAIEQAKTLTYSKVSKLISMKFGVYVTKKTIARWVRSKLRYPIPKDVPRNKALLTAYRKGFQAAIEGRSQDTCPYNCEANPKGLTGATFSIAFHNIWVKGWMAGKKSMEIPSPY